MSSPAYGEQGGWPNLDSQRELLEMEEASAWFEYKEATAGQPTPRYFDIEPWAYARLADILERLKGRKERLGIDPSPTKS